MSPRDAEIYDAWLRAGRSFAEAGRRLGISRERVRQVVTPIAGATRLRRRKHVAELLMAGDAPPREIAALVGCAVDSVYRIAREIGRPYRAPRVHGIRSTYAGGCRCAPCRLANTDQHIILYRRWRGLPEDAPVRAYSRSPYEPNRIPKNRTKGELHGTNPHD